jgi:hypothetical protein
MLRTRARAPRGQRAATTIKTMRFLRWSSLTVIGLGGLRAIHIVKGNVDRACYEAFLRRQVVRPSPAGRCST